jgi:hypothetical protein
MADSTVDEMVTAALYESRPEVNQDLFGRVDKQISSEPEWFNMNSWEQLITQHHVNIGEATACGTRRCVAGWAIHMVHEDRFGATSKPLAHMLADLTGAVVAHSASSLTMQDSEGYQEYGARILGLTYSEAGQLFYSDPALARELVHAYATGGRPAAQAAYRGHMQWPPVTEAQAPAQP